MCSSDLDLFLPDMMLAARAMQKAVSILEPEMKRQSAERHVAGRVVLGTVKGDIHEIGKNLVGMMLATSGFEVHDLGVDVAPERFVDAAREHNADIVGVSALLTTTMPYMKVVIQALKDRGIRDKYVVLVGGAPLNEEFAMAVGADAYCRDAAIAAETARKFVQ